MAQTYFPDNSETEENPPAMLFDGWGFVPLAEAELVAAPAKAETAKPEKASA